MIEMTIINTVLKINQKVTFNALSRKRSILPKKILSNNGTALCPPDGLTFPK